MLSNDFIAGYLSAVGSFMTIQTKNGPKPVFQIKTSVENKELLVEYLYTLVLSNKIYEYKSGEQKYCLLIIRDRFSLEQKVIPSIKGRLVGKKKIEFESWLKIFESLPIRYKNVKSI